MFCFVEEEEEVETAVPTKIIVLWRSCELNCKSPDLSEQSVTYRLSSFGATWTQLIIFSHFLHAKNNQAGTF